MTLRQYAAIKLKVPNSGTDWLDEMILESLRNEFAGQALTGLLAEPLYDNTSTQKLICSEHGALALNMAFASYALADAMLKARGES